MDVPVTNRTATIVDIVAVDITKAAINNAPTYIVVTQAKKKAKNRPTAAKDMKKEIIMAFTVATKKKSIKTRHPAKARNVTVPTCISCKEKTGQLR